MLKKAFLFLLFFTVIAIPGFTQDRTEILDANAKSALLGKHLLSLQ